VNSRNQSYIIYLLLFIAIVAMVYFNVRQQPNAQGPLTISQVAQQIQEGKITADEGAKLLAALRTGA
jgi:cell division protease FtsH